MLEGFIFFLSILAPVSRISDFAATWNCETSKDFLAHFGTDFETRLIKTLF
jgi:hypothetical protein